MVGARMEGRLGRRWGRGAGMAEVVWMVSTWSAASLTGTMLVSMSWRSKLGLSFTFSLMAMHCNSTSRSASHVQQSTLPPHKEGSSPCQCQLRCASLPTVLGKMLKAMHMRPSIDFV